MSPTPTPSAATAPAQTPAARDPRKQWSDARLSAVVEAAYILKEAGR